MINPIKAIIVDDEPLAAEIIESFASQIPDLEIIAKFYDPLDALFFLKENPVDLVFCDIEMPGINGLELIKTLDKMPLFIMITAFREFALEGFEVGVFDYLVKPVRQDRFLKAFYKAKDYLELRASSSAQNRSTKHLFIKSEGKMVKIVLNDLVYIEAQGDYLKLIVDDATYATQATLKSFEEKLSPRLFFRVQRSFIINLEKIKSIQGNSVELTSGTLIPIAINKKDELLRVLGLER